MRSYLFFILSFFCFASIGLAKTDDMELEKYIQRKSGYVGFLQIDRDRQIDQSTCLYVKFALEYFKKKNVSFVVLDLNTPGGEIFAASNISRLLKEIDSQEGIPVIAVIDDWAISAGAMLAYSSRFIAITNSSSMGAAEPVIMGTEGMHSASEKVNSAIRSEFANLASFYGRNPDLAEAMVDKDLVLVLRGKDIIRLKSDEEIEKKDIPITTKGKLLTLNSKQLNYYNVADLSLPSKELIPISKEEKHKKEWSSSKLLLFAHPYFQRLGEMKVISYSHWKISFFYFLTNPAVVSLLFFLMIFCGYIEFNTPGFGFFGSLAISCLALILLGSFSSYAINWLEIIILGLGIFLIGLEIFVIPGFGLTGIVGIILTIIGLALFTFPKFSPEVFPFYIKGHYFSIPDITNRILGICLAIFTSLISTVVLLRFIAPKMVARSSLIHKGDEKGYVAGYSKEELPKCGDKATVYCDLRPTGKIIIDGKIKEAKAEISFINKGTEVIISSFDGDKIIVRKKE